MDQISYDCFQELPFFAAIQDAPVFFQKGIQAIMDIGSNLRALGQINVRIHVSQNLIAHRIF